MHIRFIVITITSVIAACLMRMLFGLDNVIPDNTIIRVMYHVLNGATLTLSCIYYAMISEVTLVMKHNIRDVLSMIISCVLGVLGMLIFAIIFQRLVNSPIISILIMLVALYKFFNETIVMAIEITYPDDTNEKWIDDDKED